MKHITINISKNSGLKTRHDLIKFAVELPEEAPDNYGCDYTSNIVRLNFSISFKRKKFIQYAHLCADIAHYTFIFFNLKQILDELSEAVSNVSIYALVNIVEVEKCIKNARCDDALLYNTNIVFDRNGCIVSKYRKFNLFQESEMNVTNEPEMKTFDTDFGVTFGHFVCFDILFKSPAYDLINANVTHILYSSMWFNTPPFLTSIQIQQSFAYANNIVLLSSGENLPHNSNSGSGIFVGKHGAVSSIISYRNETKMLVAKVPKDVDDVEYQPTKENEAFEASSMDGLKLHFVDIPVSHPLQEKFVVDENGVTCDFEVNFTRLSVDEGKFGYNYRFVAFNGINNYEKSRNVGEVQCAIVSCSGSDPQTCGKKIENSENLVPSIQFHSIKIIATIDSDDDPQNYLVMPTSLDFSIHPLDTEKFKFTTEEIDDDETIQTFVVESLSELNNIMTFGIYGRNFNNDSIIRKIEDNKSDDKDDDEDAIVPSTLRYELETESSEENDSKNKSDDDEIDKGIVLSMTLYVALMVVLCIIAAVLVHRRLKDPYEHPLIVLRRKSEMQVA